MYETYYESMRRQGISRRSFLKQASLGFAGAAATSQLPLVHAGGGQGATEIKI